MSKHTQEPWNTVSDVNLGTLIRQGGLIIAKMRDLKHLGVDNKDVAERIVACVNACAGITDEQVNELPKILREFAEAVSYMDEIIQKTTEVRLLQKEYFRTRDRETLIKSKQAEAELDKLLNL